MVSCFDTQHCWQSWQRNFNPPYSHSKDDSTVRLLGETGKQRLHALKVGLKLHPLHLWSIGLCPQCWYKVYISTVGTRPWRRRTLARSKLACFNVQTCTENGKSWPHGLETFVSSLNGPILIKYIYIICLPVFFLSFTLDTLCIVSARQIFGQVWNMWCIA